MLIVLVSRFSSVSLSRRWRAPVVRAVEFFDGFGNEALVAICALMIVGNALETTGALQPLATVVSGAWSTRPLLALLVTLDCERRAQRVHEQHADRRSAHADSGWRVAAREVSRFGGHATNGFATIIGGMSTTIGTSTNLLVVGIAAGHGGCRLCDVRLRVPAIIVGGIGLVFLWLVAPRLLPDRVPPMQDTTPRIFSSQLTVHEGGFAEGKTLSEILARTNGDMRVDRIQRSESLFLAKLPSVVLQPGDRLFVKDTPENLKHYESLLGATLYNISDDEHPVDEDTPLEAEGQQLAEVVVTRGSPLHLRSLAAARFSTSYGLVPLAIHRARAPSSQITGDLTSIRLRAGDVLLVQGSRDAIDSLKASGSMLVLDGTTDLPHTQKANRALAVMAGVVAVAALGWMPIAISALIGVGLMLALGCLTWRDAAGSLSVQVIMIIVASLALGKALMVTGMADYLALSFVNVAQEMPIPVILGAFILIMTVLTNVVSNNAAAVIGTPIAIAVARQLGVDPEPFILAVLFGANMSYATPFGYQTNLLILSAGGYKFSDFLRVGIPLTVVMWIGFTLVLPVLYDL